MAGIFDDIGEFFTGNKARQAEEEQRQRQQAVDAQAAAANAAAEQNYGQANTLSGQVANDIGGSTAEYMQKANEAATTQADQSANVAAKSGIRNQLMAARSAGLNKGQSTLRAGQGAGDIYTNNFQQGLQSGRNQYQQGVSQRQGISQDQFNRGATRSDQGMNYSAMGTQMGQGQQDAANRQGATGGETTGGVLGGVLGVLSDETQKENIQSSNSLQDLLAKMKGPSIQETVEKVPAIDYNYKQGSGEDSSKQQSGVPAQAIEETAMKGNVIETPRGKEVDPGKQEVSNLGLIVQLGQMVMDLQKQLGGKNA
jgi:hypothetical protein